MNPLKLYRLIKKSAGEARWNSNYKTWDEKVILFKIIFRLRYQIEFGKPTDGPVTQPIFGFQVTGTGYRELLYLFREIFLDTQYDFQFDNDRPEIIDGGANIGMAVLYFKHRHPNCSITAFEPNPRVFSLLERNVKQNNLQGVTIVNAGLSNKEGSVDFYVNSTNSLVSSIDKTRGGQDRISVKMTRLSDAIKGKQIDLAKIDVEGAEMDVVGDLDKTETIKNVKHYVFEYHHNMPGANHTLANFLTLFDKNGFISNLKTTFEKQGDFQDILINFFKKDK